MMKTKQLDWTKKTRKYKGGVDLKCGDTFHYGIIRWINYHYPHLKIKTFDAKRKFKNYIQREMLSANKSKTKKTNME